MAAARHKAQQLSSLCRVERLDHTPKHHDSLLICVVHTAVAGVLPQVIDIDVRVHASHKNLELLLIEHTEPLGVNDLGQALEERLRLLANLPA